MRPSMLLAAGRDGGTTDRKSTRLNSSHTVIYTLSLHDALPISVDAVARTTAQGHETRRAAMNAALDATGSWTRWGNYRSEEHTSELQSHSDLHSFPTRRSSDLRRRRRQDHRPGP